MLKRSLLNISKNAADRVVMPLPEKAYEYLDYALLALKSTGGWIHYYDFEHASKKENPVEKVDVFFRSVSDQIRGLKSKSYPASRNK